MAPVFPDERDSRGRSQEFQGAARKDFEAQQETVKANSIKAYDNAKDFSHRAIEQCDEQHTRLIQCLGSRNIFTLFSSGVCAKEHYAYDTCILQAKRDMVDAHLAKVEQKNSS